MFYVALSRVTDIKHLIITELDFSKIKQDKMALKISEFFLKRYKNNENKDDN